MPESNSKIIYSIVIPCYQSGNWLEELVEEVDYQMSEYQNHWELLLVDDSSPDSGITRNCIERIAAKYENISGIILQFNSGQTAALRCGYARAKGEFVITMADDFQNPPSEIPNLIDAANDNPDVDCIFGKQKKKKHSVFRNLGSYVVNSLYRNSKFDSGGTKVTGFCIMKSEVAKSITNHKSRVLTFGPLILQNSSRVMNIDVVHEHRKYGRSGYSIRTLIGGTFDVFVNSGKSPLRTFSLLGLFVSISSFFIGGYFGLQYLTGNVGVSGFTTIVVLITFFSGLIILMLGILFEYIIRIVAEVSGREIYHEKEFFE